MTDTPQTRIFADYMDGESARLIRVSLRVEGKAATGALWLELPDGKTPVRWALGELRRVPDQAEANSIMLRRAGDDPARLKVSDHDMATYLASICPNISRRDKTPSLWRRLTILTSAAVASVALIVFVLVPVLADQLALILPTKGEQALGDATYQQIRQALGKDANTAAWECNNPAGIAALNKMMTRLQVGSNLPYNIRLHVLDHKMVNAFALPGGHIVLFRGLLKDAKNPEEVAGVIGHEMGHVESRDPTRLALRSAGSIGVLGLMFGDFAGGAAVLFLTEQLISAQYSQGAEARADVYSQNLLAATALPSAPMGDFFLRLKSKYGDTTGLASHMASHPDLKGRADKARAADTVGDTFVPVLNAREWRDLQAVCK
ncbi:MAG: M48 family metallopeptidase [Alphaproteobacteria bacterium]|nr:M48 family metallopeptidase [Alphaproteobacteria bacterium]